MNANKTKPRLITFGFGITVGAVVMYAIQWLGGRLDALSDEGRLMAELGVVTLTLGALIPLGVAAYERIVQLRSGARVEKLRNACGEAFRAGTHLYRERVKSEAEFDSWKRRNESPHG